MAGCHHDGRIMREAIRRFEARESANAVADALGLPRPTVSGWKTRWSRGILRLVDGEVWFGDERRPDSFGPPVGESAVESAEPPSVSTSDSPDAAVVFPDSEDAQAAWGRGAKDIKRPCRVWMEEQQRYAVFLRCQKEPLFWTREEADRFHEAYSHDGGSKTIHQMAVDFTMTRRQVMELLIAFGLTHASMPMTDETLAETDEEEIVGDILRAKEQRIVRQVDLLHWRQTKSLAEKYTQLQHGLINPLSELIAERLPAYVPPRLTLVPPTAAFSVWITPFDLHFGGFSWYDECGERYDFAEAEERLLGCTGDLLGRIALRGQPERLYLVTGGDWFHVDTDGGTTAKGTPQIAAGTTAQIVHQGCELAIKQIELLRQVAPVKVIIDEGNHDRVPTMALRERLIGQYVWHRQEGVEVEFSPLPRHYEVYGQALVMTTHGADCRPRELSQKFLSEAAELVGRTKYRYVFTGHLHNWKEEPDEGTLLIQCSSLAGKGRWANRKALAATPALQGFVLERERGLVATEVAPRQRGA